MSYSSMTKWEGASLLINLLSTSGRNIALSERWRLSRDRNTLSIRRQYRYAASEPESTLVYEREGTERRAPERPEVSTAIRAPAPRSYTVPAGTQLLLKVNTPISTKNAREGDKLYLVTAAPVTVNGRIIIPAGSQVRAEVARPVRPGRASGKGELELRFTGITLPNGVHRDIQAAITGADGRSLNQGAVRGGGNRGEDAQTVGGAASTGASMGRLGAGAAVGAAAGAAAGLAGVLATRGQDLTLQPGSTVEMTLDRALEYAHNELIQVQ